MEKEVVTEAVAKVQISCNVSCLGGKDFVRFMVQSTGGGVCLGRRLYVFDHRPEVVKAAKMIEAFNSSVDNKARDEAKKSLEDVFHQSAKVVVMEKSDKSESFQYLNLFPTDQSPTALLSETSYIGKHNASYNIKQDSGLWTWTSESSSRTGCHTELVLVALTDNDHKVIVYSDGYANISHSDDNLLVIGFDIQQMPEEDQIIDFEP